MTKTVKIIWTTAALLGAVSLFFNFREIPQETPPPLKNGEFLWSAGQAGRKPTG